LKTAVIIGCDGQDGTIATDLLKQKQYQVLGIGRGHPVDITRKQDVFTFLQTSKPDEIYYLAACHQSSQDQLPETSELLEMSLSINVQGLLYFCEGVRKFTPQTKLFYASSSLIFEGTISPIQDEQTPYSPKSIYGMSKLNGLLLCQYFREQYGVFASCGILYNHESVYRRENFISAKITKAALNIKQGRQDVLMLGDLNAAVDWGYAPDYVQAMHLILNAQKADDFIIASGEKHTVREFVEIAFKHLGLDWQQYVREDTSLVAKKRKCLIGNPQKLTQATGWRPSVDFPEMIKLLLKNSS
jgi:GDPmannose 4,6-dehydratase